MAHHSSELNVITWNLFHGRDRPPDRALFTWRSRLFRVTERNATHVQVNRSLLEQFATVLARQPWSVCLLQEVPPRWAEPLAKRCGAQAHRVLTSRNQFAPFTRSLGRWNPDLIASWEGGSNLTLARPPWRIAERAAVLLNPFPRRGLRERRRMALTALASTDAEVCIGNLHASAGDPARAELDVPFAAERALGFARGRPVVLGGDFNLRPRDSQIFGELERRFGFSAPTADDTIDHLLARGLGVEEAPHRLPAEARELQAGEHPWGPERLRLSDHAPMQAKFRLPESAAVTGSLDVR
jgi:endonuclease/exonuclease/phosphatase family metal-dependent hydrolase